MKIGIIGGGSIGLLFAFYLNEHHSVCLYVRSKDQLERIQTEGIRLEKNGKIRTVYPQVKLFNDWNGYEDITFIAVKQYHILNIINKLSEKKDQHHTFIFLQNGMGHLKWLNKLKGDIYLGVVEHGALRVNVNHVKHTGIGLTKIACYQNIHQIFKKNIQILSTKHFPFVIEQHYEKMLLKKLVVNAVINPLTALLNVTNGELMQNPYYFQVASTLYKEIENALQLDKVEDYFENVILVCKKTALNRSSMLCDIEQKRPTEVDSILGYILERAVEREIHTPILKTCYFAIKGKEYMVED